MHSWGPPILDAEPERFCPQSDDAARFELSTAQLDSVREPKVTSRFVFERPKAASN